MIMWAQSILSSFKADSLVKCKEPHFESLSKNDSKRPAHPMTKCKISINYVFLCLRIVFIIANCAEPDEMLPYGAFHLSIHCLPKYLSTVIQYDKG